MANSRNSGVLVPPMTKQSIADIASTIRQGLGLTQLYFPVVDIYELLHFIVEEAYFEVRTKIEMGDDHGRTYPDKSVIWVREDVYDAARCGRPRDRFTMCHELGHLVLHKGISFSRIDPNNPPKIYMNSEWQADIFASHILIPEELISPNATVYDLMNDFGVSYEAANARLAPKKKAS
jgi:Zn-dependent peptidase ImmA (M78 family)